MTKRVNVDVRIKDCMNNIGLPHFADKQYLECDDLDTIKNQVELFKKIYGESFIKQETFKVANEIIEKLD